MSWIHVAAPLALVSLASLASTAGAQEGGANAAGQAREQLDAQACGATGGGSRARANCDVESTTIRVEQELTISIEQPALPSTQCQAVGSTAYQQRNTVARVESTIKIESCTAASGEFTITLRIKDENGAIEALEFDETWQRNDDRDVSFSADYPIGENVELVSARLRGLRCTCASPVEEE